MLTVESNKRQLLKQTQDLVEQCRISVGMRAAYYRIMHAIAETGRSDGQKSLLNLLNVHLGRTAAHLFSPVELKFNIDFERPYPKNVIDRSKEVAKVLTRSWERNNTDILYGRGVFESLKYGACLLKQWAQVEGPKDTPVYYSKLVQPWQFGVYNEAENDISKQAALCETTTITLPEVWRRIHHLPNAKQLFTRIQTHARKGDALSDPQSFFHQILSTSTLQTGVSGATQPLPGGIVQLNNNPNYALMGPTVGADVVQVHELWVQDDDDYTTIIMVEPDIIIAPLYKKMNLLVPNSQLQPYRMIQPNEVTNWFWGRSELVDMVEPQALLSTWLDDMKRLFGLQVDKLLGIISETAIGDELYAQFRNAGYMQLGQGSDIKDLTPKMPPEALPMIQFVIEMLNMVGGFPEIMQGKGEAGVRAGVHADTLLKTASPTLRDRALLVERQCAIAADLSLAIKEAKDPSTYWTHGDTEQTIEATSFLLTDLPEDWRVSVDSHSSSPIFADENKQLLFASHKSGIVGKEYMLDNLPFPNKEAARAENKEAAEKQAKMMQKLMQDNPEIGEKVLTKQLTGSKR